MIQKAFSNMRNVIPVVHINVRRKTRAAIKNKTIFSTGPVNMYRKYSLYFVPDPLLLTITLYNYRNRSDCHHRT